MKEIYFSGNLFINNRRCALVSYDNGKHFILSFGAALGLNAVNHHSELTAAGVSLHQYTNATEIPAADADGVNTVLPGAKILWPGSDAHAAKVAAAAGSRGGRGGLENKTASSVTASRTESTESKKAEANTPAAVVAAGAFRCPDFSECETLKNIITLLPALSNDISAWGLNTATALLSDIDAPQYPESVQNATALVPTLSTAMVVYQNIIAQAVKAHKAEQARKAAEAEQARKAAEAAAAAAASGKNLITLSDGSTVEVSGKVHPAFAEVLEDLKDFHSVYLYGPAGTGKSYMAKQLAEALGVECYISSQSTLKYDLLGTFNADGKHIPTAFTRAAMHGGVWLWDEFDRSSSDSTTAINDALANKRVDIPGVGMIDLHPDFYVIAAGNTCGFGSDTKYVAAQQQDFSALTRFLSKIKIDYCRDMDMIVTNNNSELCDFAAEVRKAIKLTGIDIDLPIRALNPLQRKAERIGKRRALECCLFAGIGATQIKQLVSRVDGRGAWFDALKEYAETV